MPDNTTSSSSSSGGSGGGSMIGICLLFIDDTLPEGFFSIYSVMWHNSSGSDAAIVTNDYKNTYINSSSGGGNDDDNNNDNNNILHRIHSKLLTKAVVVESHSSVENVFDQVRARMRGR